MDNKMIFVNSVDGLIGDVLGTYPTLQKLSESGNTVVVKVHPEVKEMFKLVESYHLVDEDNFESFTKVDWDQEITLQSQEAFGIANTHNWYMTQAFMKQAGLEVPEIAPKAKLNYGSSSIPIPPVDYLISPFARSLPLDQKWQREKWQELVSKLKNKTFGVLGNYKYDDPMYLNGSNVRLFYSLSFDTLCKVFKNAGCLISVVTGTSHLAFHLGVKNILLNNQGFTWGTNPEAICLRDYIPNITVEQVMKKL